MNRDMKQHLPPFAESRVFTAPQPIPVQELLFQLFRDGNDNMCVDGSTTPEQFRVTAPEGSMYIVFRVIFHLRDRDISYQYFAGLGAVLSNGIRVTAHDADGTELKDFLDGDPITATGEFAHLAGSDVGKLQSGVGVDPDVVVVRWTLANTGYVPYLTPGQYLQIEIRDDLSSLDEFIAVAQGRVTPNPV